MRFNLGLMATLGLLMLTATVTIADEPYVLQYDTPAKRDAKGKGKKKPKLGGDRSHSLSQKKLLGQNNPRQEADPQLQTKSKHFPKFSWDRVPLNLHFGKRSSDMTDAEIKFAANYSTFICLEKGHGARTHGSTEAGIADTAQRIVAINPNAKVLFYLNAFLNYSGYKASDSYRDQWTLRNLDGEIVKNAAGVSRPDLSNAEFRQWWSDTVVAANMNPAIKGVFIDALPQALSTGLGRRVGEEKAEGIVAGLKEMIAMTKRRLGPESVILVNGLRGKRFGEILDWEGVDGAMIEHFGAFRSADPRTMKADLESFALAAAKGKFIVLKGWPDFNWLDREMMKRPHAELLEKSCAQISFPLACYLTAAEEGSHFCYSWGYTSTDGMLDSYPELDKKLGAPKAPAQWDGFTATRQFQHASVWLDLEKKDARIDWHLKP